MTPRPSSAQALRLNPNRSAYHISLGQALRSQGKHDEAIAEFREALRLDPDNAAAHRRLGEALRTQGKHDEAIAEFRAALRYSPDDVNTHYDLMIVLKAEGKVDEALPSAAETIRLLPVSTSYRGSLFDVYDEMTGALRARGDRAAAIAALGGSSASTPGVRRPWRG